MKKEGLRLVTLILTIFVLFGMTSCAENSGNDEEESGLDGIKGSEGSVSADTTDDQGADNTDYVFSLLPDGTYGISSYTNTTEHEITIPEAYNGKAVTQILSHAFKDADQLTSVIIPNSITNIGIAAFSGCSSLENMTLPFVGDCKKEPTSEQQYPLGYIFGKTSYPGGAETEQMFRLGRYHRSEIYYIPASLKKVTVTDGIILNGAFFGCTMMEEIVLDDGVVAIKEGAFILCENLTTVVIGEGVTEIEAEAFSHLDSLKNVTIGKNVRSIGNLAFAHCDALETITIPYEVRTIEAYAFRYCKNMKSIVFNHTSGWYRDGYGYPIRTQMTVTDPALNAINLTDEYDDDTWKR